MTSKLVLSRREFTPPGRIRGERTGFVCTSNASDVRMSAEDVKEMYEALVGTIWGEDIDPAPGEVPQQRAREALTCAGLQGASTEKLTRVLGQLAGTKGRSRCLSIPQTPEEPIRGIYITTKDCSGCLFHDSLDASRPCSLDFTPFDKEEYLGIIRGRSKQPRGRKGRGR